jgi:molybdopterin/thiamine biosynthesis adenylyltransferase
MVLLTARPEHGFNAKSELISNGKQMTPLRYPRQKFTIAAAKKKKNDKIRCRRYSQTIKKATARYAEIAQCHVVAFYTA